MRQNIKCTANSDFWCCYMLALTLLSESQSFSDMKTVEVLIQKLYGSNISFYKDSLEKFVSDEKPLNLNEFENSDWL